MEFLRRLLDPTGFVPRAVCGNWTHGEVLLSNVSDLLIALAYVSIPIMLMMFARKQRTFPFSWMSVVFALFILSCGATHVLEIVVFYVPVYRLAGLMKAVTAVSSWFAVLALYKILPQALALHSPAELAAAKNELTASHAMLQRRLLEQNQALSESNARLQTAMEDVAHANEAKSRFLANLSHELRTPIFGIIGLSEIALESGDGQVRDSLVKINRAARGLDSLLANLLEFSTLEISRAQLRSQVFTTQEIFDNIPSVFG